MKKIWLPGIAFLLCLAGWASAAEIAPSQWVTTQATPMPAERAQAIFEDERVKTFLAVAAERFGGKCPLPPYDNTVAILKQLGSGDFSSTYYEVTIPCTGDNGLAGVQITAEFSPPLGIPLNLLLTLQYRR